MKKIAFLILFLALCTPCLPQSRPSQDVVIHLAKSGNNIVLTWAASGNPTPHYQVWRGQLLQGPCCPVSSMRLLAVTDLLTYTDVGAKTSAQNYFYQIYVTP